jgi:hypothetical protein
VDTLDGCQPLPGRGQAQGETFELLEVEGRESFQSLSTSVGELQPDHPVVVVVAVSHDKASGIGPVDQLDRAVMAQEQVVGDFAHGRTARVAMAPNGQEELVLGRG